MNDYKENYIVIQAFMVQELNLKGNELILYALIHGFSQDGTSYFYGSLKYLQEQTNLSKESVLNILQKLTANGLLIKKDTKQLAVFDKEKKSYGSVHYTLYCTAYSRRHGNNVPDTDNKPADSALYENRTEKDDSAGKETVPAKPNAQTAGQESLPVPVQKVDRQPVKNLDPIINSEIQEENLSSLSETDTPERKQKERQKIIRSTINKIFGGTALFSFDFIPKLTSFCDSHKIESPEKYITWTYSLILKKNVTNFPAYFYRTILSDTNSALYLFELQKKRDKERGENASVYIPPIHCCVCKTEHSPYEDCPVCGLKISERTESEKVTLRKKIFFLPYERKSLLEKEICEARIHEGLGANPQKLNDVLSRIYEKYGVV